MIVVPSRSRTLRLRPSVGKRSIRRARKRTTSADSRTFDRTPAHSCSVERSSLTTAPAVVPGCHFRTVGASTERTAATRVLWFISARSSSATRLRRNLTRRGHRVRTGGGHSGLELIDPHAERSQRPHCSPMNSTGFPPPPKVVQFAWRETHGRFCQPVNGCAGRLGQRAF